MNVQGLIRAPVESLLNELAGLHSHGTMLSLACHLVDCPVTSPGMRASMMHLVECARVRFGERRWAARKRGFAGLCGPSAARREGAGLVAEPPVRLPNRAI